MRFERAILWLIRQLNKLVTSKRNYVIRLTDGQQFQATEVTKLETSGDEYVFYDTSNQVVMRVPKHYIAFLQDAGELQPVEKQLEQNNLPPEEVPRILTNAKRLAGRWYGEEYEGKLLVYDTETDTRFTTDLESSQLVETLISTANEYLLQKAKEATQVLALTMENIDSKPIMAINPQHWNTLLAKGEYRMVVLPCAERGDEQFHVQQTPDNVLLTRCVMKAIGPNVKRVEMQVPTEAA